MQDTFEYAQKEKCEIYEQSKAEKENFRLKLSSMSAEILQHKVSAINEIFREESRLILANYMF